MRASRCLDRRVRQENVLDLFSNIGLIQQPISQTPIGVMSAGGSGQGSARYRRKQQNRIPLPIRGIDICSAVDQRLPVVM